MFAVTPATLAAKLPKPRHPGRQPKCRRWANSILQVPAKRTRNVEAVQDNNPRCRLERPSTSLDTMSGGQGSRIGAVQVGNANKVESSPSPTANFASLIARNLQRTKLNHTRPAQPEAPLVSPSLVPQLPEPLPPLSSLSSTQEELGFFDRAKKHIGNKATYTEFLKTDESLLSRSHRQARPA